MSLLIIYNTTFYLNRAIKWLFFYFLFFKKKLTKTGVGGSVAAQVHRVKYYNTTCFFFE